MINRLKAVPQLIRVARLIFSANRSGSSLGDDYRERALWLQAEAIKALELLQIRVCRYGDFPTHGLIVSNHLSYLDILTIAAEGPVIFIAKSDVLNWPIMGNLLRHSGTIMAYRNRPLKSAQTGLEIQARLDQGLPVVLFPEGTSTDGESVKPFRSSLFQPAHSVSANIIPAAIAYTSESGDPKNDICYWGDHTFFPHLMKLPTIQNIVAHVSFGTAQVCGSNRKESAAHFHQEVSRLHADLKCLIAD